MKILEKEIDKKKVLQIYLNNFEANRRDVKKEIQKLKASNPYTVLFISGNENVSEILKDTVDIMRRNIINKDF